MNMYYWVVILGVVVAAFSQILLKKGAMRPHISFIRDYLNAPVIIGYIMMAASVVCSMIAYRGVDYMTVPVLEAIGFILVPILSFFFFKEKFTKNKVLGILLICVGIAVYYML
ncbi:MAG: EamA family transporter [Lachnospiraceae bacterium]|nr:EamA family transporter [Candidatus Colinaster scatohippi]